MSTLAYQKQASLGVALGGKGRKFVPIPLNSGKHELSLNLPLHLEHLHSFDLHRDIAVACCLALHCLCFKVVFYASDPLLIQPLSSHTQINNFKMASATAENASPIGIANLPNQRHKIVAKRGAGFTIMVCF